MEKLYFIKSTAVNYQERVTKKGKVYDVVFRIIDKKTLIEKQKKLSGFKTKREAKEQYLKFIQENCDTTDYSLEQLKENKKQELPSINEVIDIYFNSLQNQIKESSLYDKIKLFRLRILPMLGNKKLSELTKQELIIWQDNLWALKNPKTKEYYAYKYLSKNRSYLSSFLSWCESRYPDFRNELKNIKKPKRRAPKTIMQIWTKEEFEKFISVIEDPTYITFFSTLFYTGRRLGEVTALTPNDINLNDKTISFTKSITWKTIDNSPYKITSTKTELQSKTPIAETLFYRLSSYQSTGKFYFGNDKPMADTTIHRKFNNYIKLAGLKKIRIHDLRHSFVSMCIHLGGTIPLVAELIGDTIEQVTKTYAHLYQDDKRKIIDLIG